MRPIRAALLCATALIAATAWPDATVRLAIESLTPPGPYRPGQEVAVKGSLVYTDLPRPWGGEGILAGTTRHAANVALEWMRTAEDDWPEVPDMKAARGDLYFYDGGGFAEFKQEHGAAGTVWSTHISPPARTERTDPFTHSDTLPFEGTFTVPNECAAIRLRATLDNTVGANWFVSHYRYDYMPLELDLPGLRTIQVRCERKPYLPRTRTVVVSDQSDRVTISGQVTDPRCGPVSRALVSATWEGAVGQALTGPDGRYSIDLTLSDAAVVATRAAAGTLTTEARRCDFRLDSETDLITITYQVNAPGYLRRDGSINLRVPPEVKTVWVSGAIVHRDAVSEANAASGRVEPWHRVQGGTIMLQGPKGRNVFDFHWGDFTGYVPVRDEGEGALKTRRIILLDPDPNGATPQTATGDQGDPDSVDGFETQLKVIWERAPEDLRNLWLRMGLLIALKKDMEAVATGGYAGSPDNVRNYLKRWDSGGYRGKMYNALWALRESMQVLPHASLSTAADMEVHAQNAQKLYGQLKGQALTPKPGAGPLQALVQNIIDKEEAGLSW